MKTKEKNISEEKELIQEELSDSLDFIPNIELGNVLNINLYITDKIPKELKENVMYISKEEGRTLYDAYYQIQKYRIALQNQCRSVSQRSDNSAAVESGITSYILQQVYKIETNIKKLVELWVKSHYIGRWMLSITGVGPMMASAFLCYLDFDKANSMGNFWAYCGLDGKKRINPSEAEKIIKDVFEEYNYKKGDITEEMIVSISKLCKWDSKFIYRNSLDPETRKITKKSLYNCLVKPPYNLVLRKVCFLLGEQFVRSSKKEKSVYGRMYAERKLYEIEQNMNKVYAAQAEVVKAKCGKTTDAYKAACLGMLSKGHIHERCMKFAAKVFISHLYEAMWYDHNRDNSLPYPNSYFIEYLNHKDFIQPEVEYDFEDEIKDKHYHIK